MFDYPQVDLNKRGKKRNFNQMTSQPKISDFLEESFSETNKKLKLYSEKQDYDKETDLFTHLNNNFNKLGLKCNFNESLISENFQVNLQSLYLDEDVDMPEIIDIPIDNKYYNYCSEENDDEASELCINFQFQTPFDCKFILKEKIINNALESEKTMMKFFDQFNPKLQPNKENGLILYKDMKKYKNKMKSELFLNYLINSLKGKGKINFPKKEEDKIILDTLKGEQKFFNLNNKMYLD